MTNTLILDSAFQNSKLRYAATLVQAVDPSLFDPTDPRIQAEPVQVGGRQAAWFIEGVFGRAVLRHYRRGGLIGRVIDNTYFWTGAERTRSFAEFNLLNDMHSRGLPVPRPLAAAYWKYGPTYSAAIIIERIPQVQTLAKALDKPLHHGVADAIFQMHEAGVWHADLNAYNVLIDQNNKTWLIDFDRGRVTTLTLQRRMANLRRLRRSLIKVAGEQGEQYWTSVNDAYTQLMHDRNNNSG